MSATGRRALNGQKLFCCDGPGCGLTNEPLGPSWKSWCSLLDVEERPDEILTFCGIECAQNYVKANPGCGIPMPTKMDGKSEMGKRLQELADSPLTGPRTLR